METLENNRDCEVNSRGGLVRVGDREKGTLKSIFTA
jgi:hypothetical protein